MTKAELSVILVKILKHYPKFYAEQSSEQVIENWYPYLKDNDFRTVDRAVDACICTSKFAPVIADIKAQIVEAYQQDRPTALQAFQIITEAVNKSYDRRSSAEAYNELPPILQKLVGNPMILHNWHNCSSEAYHTVIMSAIRESYTELTRREAKYYAFPSELQQAQKWRLPESKHVALPEPEITKSISQVIEEANSASAAHGMVMTDQLREKHSNRLAEFSAPITKEEIAIIEKREEKKAERYLK